MANPSVETIIQPDGSLRCARCGGTQFNARHSTGRKIAVGVGTLIASANEVHCVACGAKYSRAVAAAKTPVETRACPSCAYKMPRDTSVCPRCKKESNPWIKHAAVWWCQIESGEWQWYDDRANVWRWYKDGTAIRKPSTAERIFGSGATKPSTRINPAVISPPVPAQDSAVADAAPPDESSGRSALSLEIEKLADLHERGALTDEEFRAAKARLLDL